MLQKFNNNNYKNKYNNTNDYKFNYDISKTPFINDYTSYNTYTNYIPSSIYNPNDLNYNDLNLNNQINSLRNKYMSNMINNNNDNYRNIISQLNDFPIKDPINNVTMSNNNKYINSNYINEMPEHNTYYNSTNYDSNPFLYKVKDYNNYINKRSETPKINNLYKDFNYNNNSNKQDLIRNDIVFKTDKILYNQNLPNVNNSVKSQSFRKKNQSSKNIFNFSKYNTVVNNNSFQIINNNKKNNEKKTNNNITIKPNIENIEDEKINKKYYRSYTSEFNKKSNPFIKKKFLEKTLEEENEKCSNPSNRIKIKNIKNNNSKKKDIIIRPYKYISEQTNIVNNNIIKKIPKIKIDKIDNSKNNISNPNNISPSKIFDKDLKNKNYKKNKSISTIKKPYFYNTYKIESNKKENNKTNLFKYSSIMSDLLNKNSKNYFKI